MNFDPVNYPYASRRSCLYAGSGAVCTSVPQAAQAGLEMLRRGGNAIDAAVAAAACLSVVEPCSNGVGGDAFALVWTRGRLYGLNSSGPAPQALDADKLRAMGYSSMPRHGWLGVTVPGAPAAWAELSRRFGRLSLSQLLAGAADYAERGFPVAVNVARLWGDNFARFSQLSGAEYAGFFDQFTVDGRPPRAGELFRLPQQAATLREIGETGAESFYRGALADKLVAYSQATGGYLSLDDLGGYRPQWVEPLSVDYRGWQVCELPPNGHGIVPLLALNLLSGFDLGPERDDPLTLHRQIEAIKLAFSDAARHVAEPAAMRLQPQELLSAAYADARRQLIGPRAGLPRSGDPRSGGTVYLCTADAEGNMVSYIQSNYQGFGSGLVVPDTGISLHNRGSNFSLERGHVNEYGPGKRPYHTIIPGFLLRQGRAVGPFGVMGAFMQPQGHLQLLCNCLDFQLNPQAALDAPRWQWLEGRRIEVERSMPAATIAQLERLGHQVQVVDDSSRMGRGQVIWQLDNGAYVCGVEPRCDSAAAII